MESQLTPEEQKVLLEIAREAIVTHITSGQLMPRMGDSSRLLEKRGCFVCIKKNGRLQGCIGNFVSEKPLYLQVQELAVSAATRDPRFYPMKEHDLQNFTLEISVLTPLLKIGNPEEIVVGVHGVYLEKNSSRGVLLPQVATENRWDRDTFLSQTCVKAGLEKDAWREGAEIYTFTAQIIRE